jgi:hypothetical protein
MPGFVRLEDAALALATTIPPLEDLKSRGWIKIIEMDGRRYIKGHHQLRARFVLDLRRHLQLEPDRVTALLESEKPPYCRKRILDIVTSLRAGDPAEQGVR